MPTPAKKTFAIERFMASAICLVRIEPEAPTSMPATISAVLSSAMPAAAALSPVNAFRVEITTGMSAPPIGVTASTPNAPADSRISQNSSSESEPAAITTASPTEISSSAPLITLGVRRPPFISSCSFRKAMFEPQKEIEPMIAANRIGISASSGMSTSDRNSTTLMSATAPPPTPLNSATICGIAVIFTLRAAGTPTATPIATPTTIRPQSPTPFLGERRADGDRHADGRDLVAAHRRARPAQHPQPHDEHREGDDVEQVDDVGTAHGRSDDRGGAEGCPPSSSP